MEIQNVQNCFLATFLDHKLLQEANLTVTPRMKRYPMVKMALLAQWNRGYVKEQNKQKSVKNS